MDRTGIIVVSVCVVLLIAWVVETEKQAVRQQQQAQFAATNKIVSAQTTISSTPAATAVTALDSIFDANVPEQMIVLTNVHARYTFTSRGGGLKLVELIDYPETVSARWKKQNGNPTNSVATLNTRASVPILTILGDPSFVGDGNFILTKTDDGVRAKKTLTNGLVLVKEFHLGSNYLINASVSFINTSAKPLALPAQEWVVGTATPMGPDDNGFTEGAMWFDGTKPQDESLAYFSTNTTFLTFIPRTPKTEYRAGAGNVVWAAAHNQYFALLAIPKEPAQQILALPATLPPFPNVEPIPGTPQPQGIQTALVYSEQTLAANSSTNRQITFYAGPKEYRTLARIGEEFNNRADLVMNFGFFGFFAKVLLLGMNWLHDVTKLGYGWTIVVITIILRAVFWPLTAAGMRSMKRMQALAPELKTLKEKYKDDPQKFTQKQMELWKKNKVSPMGGCLPMLIQTPVFIGFFTMIRSAIELRGAHFLWAADLSKPDTLFMIPGLTFIPFISTPDGLPFNLLPLLMVAAMVWQAHLQPPSPGMDPAQQKIMRFMPLMLLVILYNYSSGMALYMTVSTLSSVLQTKLTKTNQIPVANTIPALTPLSKKKK
jgi:YidC/Oxa1 family membrane protein insertase